MNAKIQTTVAQKALIFSEKTLRAELDVIKKKLSDIKKQIEKTIDNERRNIKRSECVDSLSPEEIFDILKNKNGWFSSEWDDVQIKWFDLESDDEFRNRLSNDAQIREQLFDQQEHLKAQHSDMERELCELKKIIKFTQANH